MKTGGKENRQETNKMMKIFEWMLQAQCVMLEVTTGVERIRT